MEQPTCTNVTTSMIAPVRQMKAVSPLATPSSMIAAFRLGSSSAAMVPASDKISRPAIGAGSERGRYGAGGSA